MHHIHLAGSGKSFDAGTEETVLAASRRAGLALPYSCLAGNCGSCKARLLQGQCGYPYNPPSALSTAEREHGEVLLCQAVALSDLSLEIREVEAVRGIPICRMQVQLEERRLLAPDVAELVLAPLSAAPLRYLPGQYLDVLLEDGKRRAFSIANAPRDDGRLFLHVRRVQGGGFTQRVFEELAIGARLDIEAPLGTFVPRAGSDRPVLFVAGGTGFAPIKAILEHLFASDTQRPIHLYWGARHAEDLYLDALCTDWQQRQRHFRYVPVLSEASSLEQRAYRHGLVHAAVLSDFPELKHFDMYMSGPPALIEAARRAFASAGLPEDRLYYDSFDYAPDVLAALIRARAGV
jgi:CDP-4-dehydro-6-deoxyglucose reductase